VEDLIKEQLSAVYLLIRHFGPLEEAEIDVSRITLFIGPNGSGKSYTAMALYAILRTLARGRAADRQEVVRVLRRVFASDLQTLINTGSQSAELSARIGGYSVDIKWHRGGDTRVDIKGEGRVPPPVYLPAARSGIMQWYPIFASIYFHLADDLPPGVVPLIRQALGPVSDFISMLFAAQSVARRPARQRKLYDVFVKHIGLETYFDGDKPVVEWEAGRSEVQLAPSGFAELAPLGLFLRYGVIKKGSFVIWEEPEAHLHPEVVYKVGNLVVDLARRGVRLLLTTHSDVLLNALSNAVARGEVSPSHISAYLFERRGRGYVATPLEVSEAGIPDDEFAKVQEKLYREYISSIYAKEREKEIR